MDFKVGDKVYWLDKGIKFPGEVESVREDGKVLYVNLLKPGSVSVFTGTVIALQREVEHREPFEVQATLTVAI